MGSCGSADLKPPLSGHPHKAGRRKSLEGGGVGAKPPSSAAGRLAASTSPFARERTPAPLPPPPDVRACPRCGEQVHALLLDDCPALPRYACARGLPDPGYARWVIQQWWRRCQSSLASSLGPCSPCIADRNHRQVLTKVHQVLANGFHAALWERIDCALERRAHYGQGDAGDAGAAEMQRTASNSPREEGGSNSPVRGLQQGGVDARSGLRWPVEGLARYAAANPQGAEDQRGALQRAVAADLTVPEDYLIGLLEDAARLLSKRPNVQRVDLPEGAKDAKCVVVGDLHGQLRDLLHIIDEHGPPRGGRGAVYYVFNGDFVDRGTRGCEVVAVVASLLLCHPDRVFLNRGNHECEKMAGAYNFRRETEVKYGPGRVFAAFCRFFSSLPLCSVVGGEIFVVHAGIPRDPRTSMKDIDAVRRNMRTIPDQEALFGDLLWSDPDDALDGCVMNQNRGAGILWGAGHTERFLAANGLRHIIRSHEMFNAGFCWHHNGRVTTVFSASHYTGAVNRNEGAVIVVVPGAGGESSPRLCMSPDTWTVFEDQFARRPSAGVQAVLPGGPSPLSPISPQQASPLGRTPLDPVHARVERRVRRELGELIARHRHQLLVRFTAADARRTGVIAAVEWAEGVRAATRVDVPWLFLRRSLAGAEPLCGAVTGGVEYLRFLRRWAPPLECRLSRPWLPFRLRWLGERCAMRALSADPPPQRVRARRYGAAWRDLVVQRWVGLTPVCAVTRQGAAGGSTYDEVEPRGGLRGGDADAAAAAAFDAYDAGLTGKLSYPEFSALVTDGLRGRMSKDEVFLLFAELLDWRPGGPRPAPPHLVAGGGAAAASFVPRATWLAALAEGRAAPLLRDHISAEGEEVDPAESCHMWDVWLLLRFRAFLRDLVRFGGDRRAAFAVFTGRVSSQGALAAGSVNRALACLRLSRVAAPPRLAQWPPDDAPGAGGLPAVPAQLEERFWRGAARWDSTGRRCWCVPVWLRAPPEEAVAEFVRRLDSDGDGEVTYLDFLDAFFAKDCDPAEEMATARGDSDEGDDDLSIAIMPTPTGSAAAQWRASRATREQGFAAAADAAEAGVPAPVLPPSAFDGATPSP